MTIPRDAMRDEGAPSSAANIRSVLRQMGDSLEAWSHWRLPKAERDLHLRHACFVRELARREKFCGELGKIAISRAMPPEDVRSELNALFRMYPFPTSFPYAVGHWAATLAAARLGDLNAIPNFRGGRMEAMMLRMFEVQFVCPLSPGSTSKGLRDLSLAGGVKVSLFNDDTRKQARTELVRDCSGALADLRRRVRKLVQGRPPDGFTVRLLRRMLEPPFEAGPYDLNAVLAGPAHASLESVVVTSFSVLWRWDESKSALNEVVERLLDGLETIAPFSHGVGKGPKTELDRRKRAVYAPARWWAMRVLDGLTVREIARKEVKYDEDAPDVQEKHNRALSMEGTIEKALERLGISLTTK